MKYLKKFEHINENVVKIGDKVICIDAGDSDHMLEYNNVYIVEKIKKQIINQYKLKDVDYYWEEDRFRTGTTEEIEELEIKKDSNKYNL